MNTLRGGCVACSHDVAVNVSLTGYRVHNPVYEQEWCYLCKTVYCQFFAKLRAVLVCADAESIFSWRSPRKWIFQQNHFSLFIRGPRGVGLMEKKWQKISWHCHFKLGPDPYKTNNTDPEPSAAVPKLVRHPVKRLVLLPRDFGKIHIHNYPSKETGSKYLILL